MGRRKIWEENKKIRSVRLRTVTGQKTSFTNVNRAARQKKIQKVKEKALTSTDIISLLRNCDNFLGVFASDELSSVRVLQTPAFLISNLDVRSGSGTHWICLRIGKSTIEIFDSLGFDRILWGSFPSGLHKFLKRYELSHSYFVSPVIQPNFTSDCGLYCVYFALYRQFKTFKDCLSPFRRLLTKNHFRLIKLLKSL